MEISDTNKQIIINEAKASYPNECCGLIVNVDNEIIVVPCNNISESPEKSFIIDSTQIKLYDINKIEGFYHSHRNGTEFSLADIAFSERLKKYCILYAVDENIFKIYQPNGFLIPYIGRPMFAGFLDCVSLFQDYYHRELNIQITKDLTHPLRYIHKEWIEQKEELIKKYGYIDVLKEYLLSNDFIEVRDLKKYDILLFQMPNLWIPSHLAVYLENNEILHHFHEYSEQTNYRNSFKRLTVGKYRHKTLI